MEKGHSNYELEDALIKREVQDKLRAMYKTEERTKRLIALAVLMTPAYDAEDILNMAEVKTYEESFGEVDWEEISAIIRVIRVELGLPISDESGDQ